MHTASYSENTSILIKQITKVVHGRAYLFTSDEHGSAGACIIIYTDSHKVLKTTAYFYSEFEPNSRQTCS